jgi:hypothetical protein
MARLRDSAIGEAFHTVLMVALPRPESLTQNGHAFVESVIRKGEGFRPKLGHRAPLISPDFLNGFTAFAPNLAACPRIG